MVGKEGSFWCQTCNEFHTLEEHSCNQVEVEENLEHLNIVNENAPFNKLIGESFFQQQQHE